MRRNPQFLVPTRSSLWVDQLCLLPRCISTADSPKIAKGSAVPFFFFFSHYLFFLSLSCTLPHFLFFHFFSLSFSFSFSSFFFFLFFIFFSFFLLSFLSPLTYRFFLFPSSERKLPLTLLFILPCVTFSMVHLSHVHMF